MPIFLIPIHETPLLEGQKELVKKYSIDKLELPTPDAQTRSVGFSSKTKTWYGWSHRAIAGFKVGDTVKKNDVIAVGVAANLRKMRDFPVGFTAKTLQDCRDMAAKFAEEVS